MNRVKVFLFSTAEVKEERVVPVVARVQVLGEGSFSKWVNTLQGKNSRRVGNGKGWSARWWETPERDMEMFEGINNVVRRDGSSENIRNQPI